MLEYLSGLHIGRMEQAHRQELEEWRLKYEQSDADREGSIDSIARGMAELASASGAPAASSVPPFAAVSSQSVKVATPEKAGAAAADAAAAGGAALPLVEITDMSKCTNCKTCYQDLSELFERTKIVVDGAPKEVARVIPGALEKVKLTPELSQRATRLANDCDAEIIRFHPPS